MKMSFQKRPKAHTNCFTKFCEVVELHVPCAGLELWNATTNWCATVADSSSKVRELRQLTCQAQIVS